MQFKRDKSAIISNDKIKSHYHDYDYKRTPPKLAGRTENIHVRVEQKR